MKVPVFRHTIERVLEVLSDENQPLSAIAHAAKYDPGLYLTFLQHCSARKATSEVSTISQAATLLGSNQITKILDDCSLILKDPDSRLLWHYAIITAEAAMRINERVPTVEPEEAFFAGMIPSIGMILMLSERPEYAKLIPLFVKLSLEDRVYVENLLFKTDHIVTLDNILTGPQRYKDMLKIIKAERFPALLKMSDQTSPAKMSVAYDESQLYHLATSAEHIAQALLFPFVVLAQENLKRTNKRYFKINESETEELLADILERYAEAAAEFGAGEAAEKMISEASEFRLPELKFLTANAPLLRILNELYANADQERNILVTGESSSGKRLLANALHYHPSNPRRARPLVSFHCGTRERDTLEEELLGARGGYWGSDQHKGGMDMADSGTIMLKDIHKMPLPLQEKLADMISKIEYYRSRKLKSQNPDIVFIATSRTDLEEEAKAGKFSRMLLRALKPVVINVPPLRERREDIGFIANGIIKKYQLPITDTATLMSLQEHYETDPFNDNLSDLKRLLFITAAKQILKA